LRISKSYVRFKRWLVRTLDAGIIGRWLSRHMENFKNRIKNFLLPHLLFEEMGFVYLGPIDGHDINKLIRYMTRARELRIPVIVHTVTKKGKGYPLSENDPEKFHGIEPSTINNGEALQGGKKSNAKLFGETLVQLAQNNDRIVAVTAAMPSGTGLTAFAKLFPDRFFDVGIAEQHAVTMAAGMAAEGMRPVVAIYSTFLQRSYDQLLHDVCLQKLPVVLAVDRAGLIGADGVTHQGIYDMAYLSTLPNMTIYAPATQQELTHMLRLAITSGEPCAIRYNRGALMQVVSEVPVEKGKWEELYPMQERTVIAVGNMVETSMTPARETGAGLINARCIKPMDEDMIMRLSTVAKRVVVVEDGIDVMGKEIALRLPGIEVVRLHVPEELVQHATVAEQRVLCGLTSDDIYRAINGA
jgi:1-deoxy-D-xylulose-5-phosphate synthase